MKFRKIGQISLAAVVSVLLMFGATSCMNDYTVGYIFAVGTQYNQIGSYYERYETGILKASPGSPYSSGGTNPIRAFVLSGGRYVYVLNEGTPQTASDGTLTYSGANISVFSIGGFGNLSFQASYSSQGANTIRILPDAGGTHLFALDTYSPVTPDSGGTTYTSSFAPKAAPTAQYPCQGSDGKFYPTGDISVFSIDSNTGRLALVTNTQQQPLTTFPVGCFPTDFTVTSGFVLTAQAGSAANGFHQDDTQTVFPYALNATNGQLTLTQNSAQHVGTSRMTTITTAQGQNLSGSKYVYLLDAGDGPVQNAGCPTTSGCILPFTVGTNGVLQSISSAVTPNDSTATNPTSLIVDSKSKYLFVVNSGPTSGITNPTSQITGWTIDPSTGVLNPIAGEPFGSGSGVNCIVEDPSNQYIYTTSFNDSQVTGRILDPNSGSLTLLRRGSSFNVVGNPTWCAVSGRVS